MAKCQFCGTSNETVEERTDGLTLCNECSTVRDGKLKELKIQEEEMEKDKSKVVEIKDFEEVENDNVAAGEKPANDTRCEIIIGVKEDGSLYFNAGGNSPDLLVIDGLLKFGKRRLKQIWEQRDAAIQQAAQEEPQTEE